MTTTVRTAHAGRGFPDALREWRTRRRLSQLELATIAGTSQRYVSFIESGRSTPGRAMVVRLAESLGVPLRERNTLLLAAGYAPAYTETSLEAPELRPVKDALESVLRGHHPYPAVVVDRHGDLVLANAAFEALTSDVPEPGLLTTPVNVGRLLLHPRGLAPRIRNLHEWAWHVIDAVRQQTAGNPSERMHALVAELEAYVPDRPTEPGPDHLGFAVPLRLSSRHGELHLLSTITHFGTAVDVTVAELRLEAFLPADEPTARALHEMRGFALPRQTPEGSAVWSSS